MFVYFTFIIPKIFNQYTCSINLIIRPTNYSKKVSNDSNKQIQAGRIHRLDTNTNSMYNGKSTKKLASWIKKKMKNYIHFNFSKITKTNDKKLGTLCSSIEGVVQKTIIKYLNTFL